jgi:AraC-like DNA-binding protein
MAGSSEEAAWWTWPHPVAETAGALPLMRQGSSMMRHDPWDPLVDVEASLLARGYAVTHPSGTVVLPTEPGWHQLVLSAAGVLSVHVGDGTWVLPPQRALWVPDGLRPVIRVAGRAALRTLYLRVGAVDAAGIERPDRPRAVHAGPLLRELVDHAVRACPLRVDDLRHVRLLGVLLDQLEDAHRLPMQLPAVKDRRLVEVATRFGRDPGEAVGLDVVARGAGASRRTLERLCRAETGLTVQQWRQRHRLVAALRLLADGLPVTAVARQVGFSTPSAFTAAFRRDLDVAPSRYFRAAQRRAPSDRG